MDTKYDFIYYIKAAAALLIINSHFDGLYPIPALATGGAVGNALFFAVSGFCLYPLHEPFRKWFPRKIIRLYVPAILMTAVSIATYYPFNLSAVAHTFIWPTIFWFIGAMALFYILFFLLRGLETNRQYQVFFVGMTVLYVICYLRLDTSVWVIETGGLLNFEGRFKLIYYFAAMMIGKWFRIHCKDPFRKRGSYVIQLAASFLSLYGGKYMINRNASLMHLQFLNQLSILWMVTALFKFVLSLPARDGGVLRKTAVFISGLTLEMYLVQFLIIYYMENIGFPINVILAFVWIIAMALLLKCVSGWIAERVFYEKNRDRDLISQ